MRIFQGEILQSSGKSSLSSVLFTDHQGDTNMHGLEARLLRVEDRGGEDVGKNECRQLIHKKDGL